MDGHMHLLRPYKGKQVEFDLNFLFYGIWFMFSPLYGRMMMNEMSHFLLELKRL